MASFLIVFVLFSSGCLERNNLDNATIYTTVYPIQYFTEILYGKHSTISSIYPDGADVNNYEFTDKQKGIFSKADLFIYNGSTDEKQLAKDFISNNRRLQIIDVAYGLRYKYAPEELWLSPNNALMLVSNIRDNLKTFIDSKFANEEINENYRNLEEILSLRDAEIRSIAKTAAQNGHNTLIVSSNSLKFLEDYGFQIISLNDSSFNEGTFNTLKKNYSNKTYKYLFVLDKDGSTEVIDELKNQGANVVKVDAMHTLNDEHRKNNDNYLTLMQEFIENIKNAVLD